MGIYTLSHTRHFLHRGCPSQQPPVRLTFEVAGPESPTRAASSQRPEPTRSARGVINTLETPAHTLCPRPAHKQPHALSSPLLPLHTPCSPPPFNNIPSNSPRRALRRGFLRFSAPLPLPLACVSQRHYHPPFPFVCEHTLQVIQTTTPLAYTPLCPERPAYLAIHHASSNSQHRLVTQPLRLHS